MLMALWPIQVQAATVDVELDISYLKQQLGDISVVVPDRSALETNL